MFVRMKSIYAAALAGLWLCGPGIAGTAGNPGTADEGPEIQNVPVANTLTEHPVATKTCLVKVPPSLIDAIGATRVKYASLPAANTDIAVVKQKLALLFHIDQGMRSPLIANMTACRKAGKKMDMKSWAPPLIAADKANEAALKVLLADIGWPNKDVYGEKSATTAFLIVQHADYDTKWQAEMLPKIASLQKAGVVEGEDYALLYDRVQEALGKPQYYGSQGHCDKGGFIPDKIRDAAHLDARRKALGMEPEAAYQQKVTEYMCP